MLNKLRQSNNKGFTIIEVMIVLAIAGMIILVVLLAVPAVQRSGRNAAIKNDAGSLAAAITEFESNNNGSIPTSFSGTGTITLTGAGSSTPATAKLQGSTTVATSAATVTSLPTVSGAGAIDVWIGHSCAGTASTRAFAVIYNTETSSGTSAQCQDT